MSQIYDVLGIGFGPANIALAIASKELQPDFNIHFVESRASTQWHPDMMLSGADIQNNPLRDLVTPRNPKSHFTFVNFLKETGRLFEHLNLGINFPLRIEYNQYVQWVANHFVDQVSFGQTVERVELLQGGDGHIGYEVTSSTGQHFKARSVVFAPGRTPYVPAILEQTNSDRIIHFTKLLSTLNAMDAIGQSPQSIAIIGSSQSAVEIGLNLRKRYPKAEIRNIIRNFGFRQKDLSPFTGEVFYPEYAQYYFDSHCLAKQQLDRDLRYTNYSAADSDVLDQLYLEMYEDKIQGKQRHKLIRNIDITSVNIQKNESIQLTMNEKYRDITSTSEFDLVISATGFRDIGTAENQEKTPSILSSINEHLEKDNQGCVLIGRDYELVTRDSIAVGSPVILNGLCEKSHGMGDAGSFSLLSLRSETILKHIAQCFSVSNFGEISSLEKELSWET